MPAGDVALAHVLRRLGAQGDVRLARVSLALARCHCAGTAAPPGASRDRFPVPALLADEAVATYRAHAGWQ